MLFSLEPESWLTKLHILFYMNDLLAGDMAQWRSVCLACLEPWVCSPGHISNFRTRKGGPGRPEFQGSQLHNKSEVKLGHTRHCLKIKD